MNSQILVIFNPWICKGLRKAAWCFGEVWRSQRRLKVLLIFVFDRFVMTPATWCNYFQLITNYSQQYATFLEFIYFYRRSACLKRFLRSSSGAHNCTYSFRYCQPILLLAATLEEMERSSIPSKVAASSSVGWQYLKLYVQLCAPDDERRNRLKHVERL